MAIFIADIRVLQIRDFPAAPNRRLLAHQIIIKVQRVMKKTLVYILLSAVAITNNCQKNDHGDITPPIPELPKEGVLVSSGVQVRIM